jgi:hypothetical protein
VILSKRFPSRLSPILYDYNSQAGNADGHYFWQDLYAARWIYELNPKNHVDVGSRIDGFVTHLTTFREIDLLDIRPLRIKVPNLNFVQYDLSKGAPLQQTAYYESVSSLHALEHFGLGRYGDPVDPNGHIKGLLSVSSLVANNGVFFLSFPTNGIIPEIQFNAQRVLTPHWWEEHLPNFQVERILQIPWKGEPIELSQNDWKNRFIKGDAALFQLKKISQ